MFFSAQHFSHNLPYFIRLGTERQQCIFSMPKWTQTSIKLKSQKNSSELSLSLSFFLFEKLSFLYQYSFFFSNQLTSFLSRVDVIKLFLDEIQKIQISFLAKTAILDHFKSNKQFQIIVLHKNSVHSFHIFVQVPIS